uniref:Uncharacterized protein n=1 Tax=Arundo donax TaxID=35708 RepID=A0A0A9H2E9_ARUDO
MLPPSITLQESNLPLLKQGNFLFSAKKQGQKNVDKMDGQVNVYFDLCFFYSTTMHVASQHCQHTEALKQKWSLFSCS